jgi:hypothetical protein
MLRELRFRDVRREMVPKDIGLRSPMQTLMRVLMGSVVSQFIVDTSGRMRPESWSIVNSTHKDFESSVKTALPRVSWKPARLRGQPSCELVREYVHFRWERSIAGVMVSG